jgi:TetR/AcrR family transcriptional regulator
MAAPSRSRRADILVAAEREFGSAGFSGGRIERIAAAAGVNKQLLFHYFGSKDGLFVAALEGLLGRFEPSPAGAGTPATTLRAMLEQLEKAARAAPGVVGTFADASANPDFPREARSVVRSRLSLLGKQLEMILAEGQQRGYFRDDIDPAAVAQLALAAALGSGVVEKPPVPPVGDFILDHCAWR